MATIGEIFFEKFLSCDEEQKPDGSYRVQYIFGFPSLAYGDPIIGFAMGAYLFERYKGLISEPPTGYTSSCKGVNIEASDFTLDVVPEKALAARKVTSAIIEDYFTAKQCAADSKLEAARLMDLPKPITKQARVSHLAQR